MSASSNAPKCVQCGQTSDMVVENQSLTGTTWHCRNCLTKTSQKNWFGKWGRYAVAPVLIAIGIPIVD